ncbi:oxidoreductase [Cryobacterium psychrophilum]|uniref:SDR family NAD(P)-dependent oxidoreductase n=1 Tax=Cryobacterium psychrophilum TaxID=41988 RepID=A0A4Y8KTH7_9MICO|nr:oxidoreductase [Cryobacterium psychrophilum]TDW31079.1 short-subunit dehydrogenase [Cryobacterium psychrophilum]TFD78620.1 SDR family NAD(P)-dependent oxidoreductase [Cryobacterium psychrophilum]
MTITTAVLITGTSSGIGRATAERLARRPDLAVYATARHVETLDDLARAGARILPLDVTDEASMRAAVDVVEAAHGAVGVLINNAGYGTYGTIEETDLDAVRTQFETNVFGLARMTQLVLPGMRAAGVGRIVNVGSMGGRLVFPVGGYYHASKYAVEALTDALRFEVAPFGVKVSLIEPGLIRTAFSAAVAGTLAKSATPSGPYAGLNASADQQMADGYGSDLLTASADAVAKVIEKAALAARPRARYLITPAAKFLVHTRQLLGSRVFDAYLRKQFRSDAAPLSLSPLKIYR